MLAQPDGKIVQAGSVEFSQSSEDFGLARFNADGTPDVTFGSGGTVTTDFSGGTNDLREAFLQPDGTIVAVGTATDQLGSHIVMARYRSDGSLDSGFGVGGKIVTTVPGFYRVLGAAIESDGKIIVFITMLISEVELVRFQANGSLDTSYGTGGIAPVIFADGGQLLAAPDNRLYLANEGRLVMRFNPDGSLDTTFGSGGVVETDNTGGNQVMALQPDGELLVADHIGPSEAGTLEVLRYDVNGSLDPTFGGGGHAAIPRGFSPFSVDASSLAVDTDGRIILAGNLQPQGAAPLSLVIVRFDPNGTVDTQFGGGFLSTLAMDGADDLAIEPDGKILVAGSISQTGSAVGRLLVNDPLPTASQRFVAQAYLDVLLRTVEPAALAGWSAMIDQGQATRAQVLLDIEASAEYLNLKVQELFGIFLNRPAITAEAIAYADFLGTGGTIEQVEVTLVGSPEYYRTRGGTVNAVFLDALYRDALGRAVDPTGMAAFGPPLDSGALSTTQVAAVVFASDEFFGRFGLSLYQQFLHRDADPTGLNAVINALQQGITDQAIVAGIVGSDEYLATRT